MKSFLRSAASVITTCVVDGFFWPTYTAVMAPVLFTHEMGHYMTGYTSGGQVELPLLVPLGPVTLGLTKVKDPTRPGLVAIAGPIYGLLAAGVFFLTLVAFDLLSVLLMPLSVIAGYQLVGLMLGSDAKKFAQR